LKVFDLREACHFQPAVQPELQQLKHADKATTFMLSTLSKFGCQHTEFKECAAVLQQCGDCNAAATSVLVHKTALSHSVGSNLCQ
jgi:bacterioferritin-associated ferredoxin